MRWILLFLALLLSACAPPPSPKSVEPPKPDPTVEAWFAQTLTELQTLNRDAEALVKRRKFDQASALITKGQGLMARLLAVPRPTVAAVEAASDLDELYGRMLLTNKHYGWARLQFQKNVARWKNWQPRTEETERRLKAAESLVIEVDRRIEQQ